MLSSGESSNRSTSHAQQNESSKAKKSYQAPKFTVLKPDQAEVELKAKGLPDDPGVQKLLCLTAKTDTETSEVVAANASLLAVYDQHR